MKNGRWFAAAAAASLFGAGAGLAAVVRAPAAAPVAMARTGIVLAVDGGEAAARALFRFSVVAQAGARGGVWVVEKAPDEVEVHARRARVDDGSEALLGGRPEAFLALPTGEYTISVEAVAADGTLMPGCPTATLLDVPVTGGTTTEAILFVQCGARSEASRPSGS